MTDPRRMRAWEAFKQEVFVSSVITTITEAARHGQLNRNRPYFMGKLREALSAALDAYDQAPPCPGIEMLMVKSRTRYLEHCKGCQHAKA